MQADHASTTRRALFAAATVLPILADSAAASAAPRNSRLEQRLDVLLSQGRRLNSKGSASDADHAAHEAAWAGPYDAAVALEGSDLETLRIKAKAMLLLFGSSLADMATDDGGDTLLRNQIVAALVGAR